jgi:hypothetical protein
VPEQAAATRAGDTPAEKLAPKNGPGFVLCQPNEMYVRDLQVDTQMAKPWENFIDWRS